MKKVITFMLVLLLVFSVCTISFAGTTGDYSGSCLNQFTCSETWNKISDDYFKNNNTYARLYSSGSSGTECAYQSLFQVIDKNTGAVNATSGNIVSSHGNTITWKDSSGAQGTAKLTIVNGYYAGTRLYAKGVFTIYD